MAKILHIPISRFEPERAVSCDIYLNLALNNKNIKIVNAGDRIPADLLIRISQRGHASLGVTWDESKGSDPGTYPIFLDSAVMQEEAPSLSSSEPQAESLTPEQTALGIETQEKAPSPETISGTEQNSSQIFSAEENAAEPETAISGEAAVIEPEQRFSAGVTEPEPETKFSSPASGAEPEMRVSKSEAQEEPETKFSADAPDSQEPERVFSRDPKPKEQVTKFSSKENNEPEESQRFANSDLAPKGKEVLAFGANNKKNANESLPVQSIKQDSIRNQNQALEIALESEDSSTGNSSENELTLVRGARSQAELEVAVSRLSVYLGHSLGYSNPDFLIDLSTSAVAYFTRKAGNQIPEERVPKILKLTESELFDSVIDDCRGIISLLEEYTSDPDCDWGEKELSKKIFENALTSLSRKESSIDPICAGKWEAYISRPVSMDAYSLCTKASAKALRQARDLVAS